jgi:rRNA maturation endonuclease Nob1
MPVCTSCNIEYEEDKKFCNYCGGPLTPKTESTSAPKKVNRADEEKSEGKLFCPHCKITYEFGSSCIQCGSPLGRQTSSQDKGEPEVTRGTQFEEKLPAVETSQEQKSGASGGKLICPTCKIIYERGTSCTKCESTLVPQASTQKNGKPEISSGSEVEGNNLQVQPIEGQFVAEIVVETPRKKLICPSCKIIYERGTSCVRCGAALVPQTPSKEKEKPKSSDTEFNLSTSEPDGLEDAFLPRGSTEPSVAPGQGPGATPEQPSPSSPKGRDPIAPEPGKKREFRATPPPELSLEEEYLQAQTPEQPIAKKSADNLHNRVTFLSKLKKDYRRLGLEVGSIMIMVLAGGYLLWSVYSYFTKPKPPEPGAPVSKNAGLEAPRKASSSTPPAVVVAASGESRKTEGNSPVSKEIASAPPSLLDAPKTPEAPKTPSVETQEIGKEIGNIMTLLENVRQSNLKKDIDLFVSCYSSDFENMEGRKRATVAYWEKFSYLDLAYDLKDLSISVEKAKARVEWLIKTSSRDGGQSQQNKSVLDVAFKKEDGRWKIKEVKPAK